MSLAGELAFAMELADLADGITLPPFAAREVTYDWKANHTEVTALDRGAEAAIAARLADARPHHRLLGEELGTSGDPDSPWQWIVDPIDGTSGYVRGVPVWATLIGLVHEGEVVVAVVSAPAMGRRWWATRGGGSFVDGRPCRVSTIDRLADAQVSVTLNDGWDVLGLTPAVVALAQEARRQARGFGDFWQHCLVAEGAVDIAVDAVGVAPYDIAAVKLIVEEAGGTFTDRFGTATHESDTAISSNGLLHAEVLARLAG